MGLPPIYGALYTDFGYLSHVDDDTNNIHDSGNLRASVGVGIGWKSHWTNWLVLPMPFKRELVRPKFLALILAHGFKVYSI